jgi:hypothetical protein
LLALTVFAAVPAKAAVVVGVGVGGPGYYRPYPGYYRGYYPGYYSSYYSSYYYGPPAVYMPPPVVYAAPPPVAYVAPPPPAYVAPAPSYVTSSGAAVTANQTSPTFKDSQGRTCRTFQSTPGGDAGPPTGTACLMSDGTWHVTQ